MSRYETIMRAMADDELPRVDLKILAAMYRYADAEGAPFQIGYTAIAHAADTSHASVRNAMRRLRRGGYIERIVESNGSGPSEYRFPS